MVKAKTINETEPTAPAEPRALAKESYSSANQGNFHARFKFTIEKVKQSAIRVSFSRTDNEKLEYTLDISLSEQGNREFVNSIHIKRGEEPHHKRWGI